MYTYTYYILTLHKQKLLYNSISHVYSDIKSPHMYLPYVGKAKKIYFYTVQFMTVDEIQLYGE